MLVKALLPFVFLGLVCAASSANFRVREKLNAAPHAFTSVGPASPEQTITLRLALAQGNAGGVVDALYSVSDPASSKYGQHLTKQEVESLVAPKSDTKDAVDTWLKTNGLTATTLSPAGDWISIQVPVSKANELFDANFTTFTNQNTGKDVIRTLSYSLPEVLQGHVDLVHPTVSFPASVELPSAAKQKRAFHSIVQRDPSSACSADNTTIPCLQELYGIPLTPATQKNNSLGVTGFFGNNAHRDWLKIFLQTYRPDMDPDTNYTFVGFDGGVDDPTAPSVSEGELDIQYTVGLATNVNVTYYFGGIDNQDGDLSGFLDELNMLLSLDTPPLVLTTSYGRSESGLTFDLVDKACQAYAQLGARGTTILFASGDSGVGCGQTNETLFSPRFPSDCPFVTSVGGTQSFSPEEAWAGSSGGFSNYYARPSYQDAAVSAWLDAHGSENAGRFNASGRAFPDLAAKADRFIIYASVFFPIFGTSASSPSLGSRPSTLLPEACLCLR
ncbi:family S53 protease-like protein [Polyporus arcularius HHB13444]|uniref:Family S53 protease-like protein n=1 Tax=Polyporus arcularius HHB13444 TaxID=1314778 RepID=A0A5C3NUV1_9APHY|nr:family S53 protease-like protein [Polyporus arcularius HHB13444]